MPSKCDKQLDWWLRLANLYRERLAEVSDPNAGDPGVSQRVRRLVGPRPLGINLMLHPAGLVDEIIVPGNHPDQSLWGLAGVANAILSRLAEEARKPAGVAAQIIL